MPAGLIFHIADAEEWQVAVRSGWYRTSTRGQSLDDVGFIHASHRHQVERVANGFYRDAPGPLVLLGIDPGRLGSTGVREESVGGIETFPHLAGPLPLSAVVDVSPFEPAPGGLFVPPSSWLSPKLEVRPSAIEGLGLFARADIDAGEPVSVMGGRALSDDEFAAHAASVSAYSGAAVDEGVNVLQELGDPATRGNHSCEPNLWMADELTAAARRPIEAGEEAALDYALLTADEGWSMHCGCGSSRCRGVVTGSDWRRPDLQAEYRGHFSPFIERRIATS